MALTSSLEEFTIYIFKALGLSCQPGLMPYLISSFVEYKDDETNRSGETYQFINDILRQQATTAEITISVPARLPALPPLDGNSSIVDQLSSYIDKITPCEPMGKDQPRQHQSSPLQLSSSSNVKKTKRKEKSHSFQLGEKLNKMYHKKLASENSEEPAYLRFTDTDQVLNGEESGTSSEISNLDDFLLSLEEREEELESDSDTQENHFTSSTVQDVNKNSEDIFLEMESEFTGQTSNRTEDMIERQTTVASSIEPDSSNTLSHSKHFNMSIFLAKLNKIEKRVNRIGSALNIKPASVLNVDVEDQPDEIEHDPHFINVSKFYRRVNANGKITAKYNREFYNNVDQLFHSNMTRLFYIMKDKLYKLNRSEADQFKIRYSFKTYFTGSHYYIKFYFKLVFSDTFSKMLKLSFRNIILKFFNKFKSFLSYNNMNTFSPKKILKD